MSTWGQAITGVVGLGIGLLFPGPGWFIGLSIGLTLGGILFPASIESPGYTPMGLNIQSSELGKVVPVLYGSRKMAGNLIWYGNFQTHAHEESGGKGGGGTSYTTYTYSVGLAFGICMAPSDSRKSIAKVWAGKDLVNSSKYRFYNGSQTIPDSYIAGFTTRDPVWKNLCYIVFESYDLGNSPQIPNFTYEVVSNDYQIGGASLLKTWLCGNMSADGKYRIVGTASDKIYISSDFGFTWSQVGLSKNYTGVAVSDNGQYLAAVGFLSYVNVSSDYGQTWVEKGLYKNYRSLGMSSCGRYIVATYQYDAPNVIAVSSDYGQTWTEIYAPFGAYDVCVLPSGQQQYVLASSNKFYRSLNYGVTWTLENVNEGVGIYFDVSDDGKYQTKCSNVSDGWMYVSSDYGVTYSSILQLSGGKIWRDVKVSGSGQHQIAVTTSSVNFYISHDYGLTWNAKAFAANWYGIAVSGTGQYMMACVYSSYIYYSSDYGETWSIYSEVAIEIIDTPPPDVSKDILTNNLFGLGLDSSCLKESAFADTRLYCEANDLLISVVFNSQISVLDALGYIIQHHNGYITYYDGLIAHNQLQAVTPTQSLTKANNDFVEDTDFPIEISKAGGRDYSNKVNVEYTKREAEYVSGMVVADDIVDIDKFRVKDITMSLDGLCTHSRAIKMAWVYLKKSLIQPQGLKFKLGPKSKAKVYPGNVVAITDDSVELSNLPIRILAIREDEDKKIEVEAIEENNSIYDYNYMTEGEDPPSSPEAPSLRDPALSVMHPMAMEIPPLFVSTCEARIVYSKPADNLPWAGASVYKAYEFGGSYVRKLSNTGSGVTGKVIAVGLTNDIAYVSVELDWDYTLVSATSFDSLLITPGKNLMVVNGIFCRYQTVELLAAKQWKLTGLIYDTVNFPLLNMYGSIIVNDEILFYQGTMNVLGLLDKHRTLYFKIPSFNLYGEEQSLADVSSISLAVAALVDKPLSIYNYQVNGIGVDSDDTIIVSSGDISLVWMSRNRFNNGGYNYSKSDAIVDDTDFSKFIIEIWRNSILKRTTEQIAKSWIYTSAMQTTDGGTGDITFKCRQVGTLEISPDKSCVITVI